MVVEPVVPLPVKLATWGAFGALSEILKDAVRAPKSLGEKFTLILHCAPGASEPGQLLVCAKSPGFGPETAIFVITNRECPLFLRVVV